MKKIILSSLLIGLFTLSVLAQNEKKVEFGLKTGYAYNMPKGTDASVTKFNLNGIYAGAVLNFKMNESFGIQSGLSYSYFSNLNKYNVVLDNWSQYQSIAHYLDLPIRFRFTYPLADDFNLHLLAGPNLNYGLNKHVDLERVVNKKVASELTVKGDNIYSETSTYSPLDLQFGIGVGIQYYKITLHAGYDWGLLDRNITKDNTFKANDIKVGISYTF